MTHVLTFDGDKANQRFQFCFIAMLMGGDPDAKRTRDLIRKEARILDLFDAISIEDKAAPQSGRTIMPGLHTVTLDHDDYELLRKRLDDGQWLPAVSQKVVDAQNFVDTAEKRD